MERKLILKDYIFKATVRDVEGYIRAEQGFVCFHSPEEQLVIPLPFYVPAEYFDTKTVVTLRNCDNKILLDLGKDDIYENQVTDSCIPIENLDLLVEKMENRKLKEVPKLFVYLACILVGGLGIVLASILRFNFWYIVDIVGALIVAFGIVKLKSLGSYLNQTVIMDRAGRWVDLHTGRTNLDGNPQMKGTYK